MRRLRANHKRDSSECLFLRCRFLQMISAGYVIAHEVYRSFASTCAEPDFFTFRALVRKGEQAGDVKGSL